MNSDALKKAKRIAKRKSIARLLLSVALFAVIVCIVGPFELFITNRSEFWFGLKEMLLIVGAMTGAAIVVLGVIGLILRGKARACYTALLFAVAVGLYLQSNFLNIDYGLLDGKAIDWGSYGTYAIVNTAVWVVLVAAVIVLWALKKKLFWTIHRYGAAALMAMQILTLGLLFMTSDVLAPVEDENYYLSDKNLYSVGEKDNIIIFVLDAFDEAYLQQLLEEDPAKYKEMLDGFTHYTNAAAGGATTYSAMPIIITGEHYPGEVSYNDYVKNSFNRDGLYTELTKQGYSVNMYTEDDFVPAKAADYIDNLVSGEYTVSSPLGFLKTYGKLTLYRQVPHLLKQFFWIYSDDLKAYRQADSDEGAGAYITDDIAFYQKLTESRLQLMDGKVFTLIHMGGAHPPYNMDEYCQPADVSSPIIKSRGSLFLVSEYLEQMKALGVYDNSTIIIMADHGQEILSRGIVLVKPQYAKGYVENDAPISHFDLHNTFFELLGKETGESIFDIQEGAQRTRMFYPQSSKDGSFFMTEYKIEGNPRDVKNGTKTGVVLSPRITSVKYEWGTKLTFGADGTSNSYVESGLNTLHVDYAWTDGNETVFKFPLANVPKHDLELELEYYTVYLEINDQYVGVYVDDVLLFGELMTSAKQRTLHIEIPKELAQDGELVLRLHMPDAKCPAEVLGPGNDPHTLGLALTGLTIKELDWSKVPEYSLGTQLAFGVDSTVKDYIVQCVSESDTMGFGWTNGLEPIFRMRLKDKPTTDLECTLNITSVMADFGSQRVRIMVNGTQYYEDVMFEAHDITFTIPKNAIESGNVDLRIILPDAESPYEKTGHGDRRVLGLALTGLTLAPVESAAN